MEWDGGDGTERMGRKAGGWETIRDGGGTEEMGSRKEGRQGRDGTEGTGYGEDGTATRRKEGTGGTRRIGTKRMEGGRDGRDGKEGTAGKGWEWKRRDGGDEMKG